MKKCSKCNTEKNKSEFNIKRNKTQPYCKSCQSIYHKKWYDKNKENRKKQIFKRRKDNFEWFYNLKESMGWKCKICGEDRIETLDFHHINPEEKDDTISGLLIRGCSKKRILMEIEKCDILCSNCHRILHYRKN